MEKRQTNVCLPGLSYRFHLDTFLLRQTQDLRKRLLGHTTPI